MKTSTIAICIVALFGFVLSSPTANAQEYTLPVSDQEAFLSEARPYIHSFTFGRLFAIGKNEDAKVRPAVGFRLGYSERTLNFRNNMVFSDATSPITMRVNDDPTHDYENRFWRRGMTRLRGEYVRIGGSVGLKFGEFMQLSTGVNADIRVRSIYQNRYFEDDVRVRERIIGNDKLPLNATQFSWVIQAGTEGLSVCYEISFNDFFGEAWGLDYQFQSFGIVYGF